MSKLAKLNHKTYLIIMGITIVIFSNNNCLAVTTNESIQNNESSSIIVASNPPQLQITTLRKYISFNPKIDEPSVNDPRITTITMLANSSQNPVQINYYIADNERFANQLKNLLQGNGIKNVIVNKSDGNINNASLVYVYIGS